MAAYDVNYDDERFTQVETEKQEALSDLEKTYTGMIDKSDKFYQDQINASKDYADKQTQIQNANTDFAIQKIEQQKEQAQKDYIKEQSGAYADWRKQSNEYGAEAEKMAASGLQRTGFSESSQVSMYNAYQNRVAIARESIQRAIQDYNNGITEARLQNNAALAEIKFNALKQQLELSLQGFQYKNQLIETLASKKTETEQIFHNRYQEVLAQINHENAMAEEIRQHNEALALQKEQLAEEKRQFNEQMAYTKSKSSGSGGGGGGGGGSTITKDNETITKTQTGSSTKSMLAEYFGAPINGNSILALGYGPINETRVLELIKQGKVQPYMNNGQVHFRKTPGTEGKKYIFGF